MQAKHYSIICCDSGESGAGKTENTKKVIGYFAMVAAMQQEAASKGEEEKSDEKVTSQLLY